MDIAFAAATTPARGTWVVLAASDGTLGPTGSELDRRTGGALRRAIADWDGNFKRGETIELRYPPGLELDRVLVLSLGKPEEASRYDLETVGGALAVRLNGLRVREASVAVEPVGSLKASAHDLAISLATGACLRAYRFDKYRTAKDAEEDQSAKAAKLTLHLAEPAAVEAAWPAAAAVIAGVSHGRDLVTEPANVLSPEAFAEACLELGSALGLEVEVLDRAALQRLGMNALLAVGQGSAHESRVATLRNSASWW